MSQKFPKMSYKNRVQESCIKDWKQMERRYVKHIQEG